ncbi:Endocuticle structural glycoprotein [Operophtera brumata]|uniref:Endocuticle structural glycoprotein n=1 Tax=Operophtera brumata TaxID=104452 RepID=A0A0L7L6C6_OPEBR|nr:Endocuticle structural glycoprotein [Operophtera brumata]
MNTITVLLVLSAAYAIAAPTAESDRLRNLPALQHEEIHDEYGQYSLRYVTAEGTIVSERGRLVPTLDGTGHVIVVEGDFSYIGDDGKTYATKYTAGFDGYKPEGEHL